MTKADFVPWASAPPSWITSSGNDLDGIVVSSRVRIARNFLGIPFPHHSSIVQQKKCFDNTLEALKLSKVMEKSSSFRLNLLSPLERSFLMERQLISHEHAGKEGEVGLVVSSGESVSVMVNEEDHIRAACFRPGLGLAEAWGTISQLDDDLGGKLPLSYNSELGYITACPTNIGTGLRASCLLHLPALVLTGKIHTVIKYLSNSGLTARGFYGEGTTAVGDLFQISNTRTLGQTEVQIIKDVDQAVKEICELEKDEEQNLLEDEYRLQTEDQLTRAFGTLQWARTLNYGEGMKHLSQVRLGAKLLKNYPVKLDKVTCLFFLAQPAHLQIRTGKPKPSVPDEVLRADFIRGELNPGVAEH